MYKSVLLFTVVSMILFAACAQATPLPPSLSPQPRTITIMTHDSFAISEGALAKFETEQMKVQFLKAGDAGTTLNKAILSRNNPMADVLYGVDNTFLSRALAEDIYLPYNSPQLVNIAAELKLDPQNRATPVDYGDVCPNYHKVFFTERNLNPPQNLSDLLKPEYKGLLVVENPAISSPGLSFLLATIGVFGETGYLDFWQGLKKNDLLVVNDWETAYYTEFSAHGGTHPIVISYGSSPPAEVIYAETPIEEPPTAVIVGDRSCFRQIEFVGILRGTRNQDLAEKWIDFMLSNTFQEDMPLQMFVFPVIKTAQLPAEFQKFATIPTETAQVSPEDIREKREQWIKDWTELILR